MIAVVYLGLTMLSCSIQCHKTLIPARCQGPRLPRICGKLVPAKKYELPQEGKSNFCDYNYQLSQLHQKHTSPPWTACIINYIASRSCNKLDENNILSIGLLILLRHRLRQPRHLFRVTTVSLLTDVLILDSLQSTPFSSV